MLFKYVRYILFEINNELVNTLINFYLLYEIRYLTKEF